jgi:choice-of-anchor B domain-containing protein
MMYKAIALTAFMVLYFSFSGHTQDQLNMSLLANWDVDTLPRQSGIQYNDIWGYVDCSGNEYAIMGSAGYIHFFDLSQPDTAIEIASFAGNSTTIWRDMKTYADHAYAVADNLNDGLMVFDLSQVPDTVARTSWSSTFFSQAHNIFIDEPNGRMYAVGTDTRSNGVIILDLKSDPGNPTLLSSIPLPGGYIHDIYVRDNIAYCSHGFTGLYIYDLTDPGMPITLATITNYPESGYNHASWLSDDGNHLVFVDETHGRGVKLADISALPDYSITDVFRSTLLAPDHTSSIVHNPYIRGQYILASYYHDGLQVFDFSNPDSVTRVAYYDTNENHNSYSGFVGAWGCYPFLPSGRILGSDMDNGLFVLSADSLTLAPITPITNPETTLNLSDEIILCVGDTAVLQAPEGYDQYTWLQDGNIYAEDTTAIAVYDAGIYEVVIRNGHCSAPSESIAFEVVVVPAIEFAVPDFSLCATDTLLLEAPFSGDYYQWYVDGTPIPDNDFPELLIPGAGEYQLEIQIQGCSNFSNIVEVSITEEPDLGWWPEEDAFLCAEESYILNLPMANGNINIFRDGDLLPPAVESVVVLEESGGYWVEITDGPCEVTSTIFELDIAPLFVPFVTQQSDTLLTVPGLQYQWFLNGIPIPSANARYHVLDADGTYFVEVRSFDGCIGQSTPVDVVLTDVSAPNATPRFEVFPNPFSSQFTLQVPTKQFPLNYLIVNILGEVVESGLISNNSHNFDLNDVPDGTYILILENQKNRHPIMLYKQ